MHAGRDLRAIFALLHTDENGQKPPYHSLLLKSLAVMAQHEGPAAFFDFADEDAGLMRTSSLKLPSMRLDQHLEPCQIPVFFEILTHMHF